MLPKALQRSNRSLNGLGVALSSLSLAAPWRTGSPEAQAGDVCIVGIGQWIETGVASVFLEEPANERRVVGVVTCGQYQGVCDDDDAMMMR